MMSLQICYTMTHNDVIVPKDRVYLALAQVISSSKLPVTSVYLAYTPPYILLLKWEGNMVRYCTLV